MIYDPFALGLEITSWMGDEAQCHCPYHDDSHPSAEYNISKQVFYCFGCHTAKTAEQLASDLGGVLIPVSDSYVKSKVIKSSKPSPDWRDLLKNLLAYDNEYLISRYVTAPQIFEFDIKANSQGVIFPIHDKFDQVVGVQIRHYTKHPKYQIFGSRQPVWPMWRLLSADHLYITEGVFGVLRADLAGELAVALMGSGNIPSAVRQLTAVLPKRKIVGVMDNDYAGLLAAGKLTLHGIGVILAKKAPDEWSSDSWGHVHEAPVTYNVNDVINRAGGRSLELTAQLKKYWSKLK